MEFVEHFAAAITSASRSSYGLAALAILAVAGIIHIAIPQTDMFRVLVIVLSAGGILAFAFLVIRQMPAQSLPPGASSAAPGPRPADTATPAIPPAAMPAVAAPLVGPESRSEGKSVDSGFRETMDRVNTLIQQSEYVRALRLLDETRRGLSGIDHREASLRDGEVLIETGKVERLRGNPDRARKSIGDGLDLLPSDATPVRAYGELQLGITLRLLDDRAGARIALESAKRDFTGLGNRAGMGLANQELAQLFLLNDDVPSALARLNEARTDFEAAGDRIGEAVVERMTGEAELTAGRPELALPHLHRAIAAFRALEHNLGLATSHAQLGEANAHLGRWAEASQAIGESLQIAQATSYQLGVRNGYLALANLEARRGRFKEAADGFSRAIDYFQAAGDQLGEMQARLGLGSVQTRLGDPVEAGRQLERAGTMARNLRETAIRSEVLTNQGAIAFQDGDPVRAGSLFQEALGLAVEAGDRLREAQALQGLGDVQASTGQEEEAIRSLGRARTIFAQASATENAAVAGLSLASLKLKRGDRSGCTLLSEVTGEFRQIGRTDLLGLAATLKQRSECP